MADRPIFDSNLLRTLAAEAGLASPSIVVEELGSPGKLEALWSAELDSGRHLYPASIIKLPIAYALALAFDQARLRRSDRRTVDAANVTANDAPSAFVAGYEAELQAFGFAMLSASDNVATNVLIDVLGREAISQTCRTIGLPETVVRRKLSGSLPLIDDPAATGRNSHPARDAAALLRLIARDEALEPGWIYGALLAQIWNDKLPRGLRPGDTFAHKTGDTDEVSHDGGILTLPGGRRFVLVVYTALRSCPESDARLAAFAALLRPHFDAQS